jgi:hypothetical protein
LFEIKRVLMGLGSRNIKCDENSWYYIRGNLDEVVHLRDFEVLR